MTPRKRHRARKLAVQAIYQWQLAGVSLSDLLHQYLTEHNGARFDTEYFSDIVTGVTQQVITIDQHIAPVSSRKISECDPVELAVLRLATYELLHRVDVPYRIVINEALELNKTFGTEEGYKFINGILDKLASRLRQTEIATVKPL